MRTTLLLSALLAMGGLASADANHQILAKDAIKGKDGKVIGFRATVLVDPQRLTQNHATLAGDVRLGLGSLKYAGSRTNNDHRDATAGVKPGYILHQFKMREITGPNPTDRGAPVETLATAGAAKEVEIEVLYADNPQLKPGMKTDLVAAFWKGSYWHPWGAADSPTHSSQDFVIELPADHTP